MEPTANTTCHLSPEQCRDIVNNQEGLKKSVSKMATDVSLIKVALLGDEYHPGGGIVTMATENRRRIRKVEVRQAITWGVGAALITLFTFFDKLKDFLGG